MPDLLLATKIKLKGEASSDVKLTVDIQFQSSELTLDLSDLTTQLQTNQTELMEFRKYGAREVDRALSQTVMWNVVTVDTTSEWKMLKTLQIIQLRISKST